MNQTILVQEISENYFEIGEALVIISMNTVHARLFIIYQ